MGTFLLALVCIGIGLIQTIALIGFYGYLWFAPGPQNGFYLKLLLVSENRECIREFIAEAPKGILEVFLGICMICFACFIAEFALPMIAVITLNCVKGAVSLADLLLISTIPTIYHMAYNYFEIIEIIKKYGDLFEKFMATIAVAFSSAIPILACLAGWLFIVYFWL